jgi:hypothetical protein
MTWTAKCLAAIQIGPVGLVAVGTGIAMVLDPSGRSLRMTQEPLAGSPFPTYLVPGIVLLTFNGLGSLIGGAASLIRARRAPELAIGLGAFLMAWISVQVWWIGLDNALQPVYFLLGATEVALGVRLLGERRPGLAGTKTHEGD